MYTSTNKKKDFFYYIILILTFIVVIIGATFAIYTFLNRQEEGSSAVYTGTLSIEYYDGEIINCVGLYPVEDPDYDAEENVYKNTFKVTNTGTLNSLLSIYIDINTNDFTDKYLMYNLYNESGGVIETGNITGTGNFSLTSNLSLDNGESATFTLMIWLQENGENQNEDMKKTLAGTIVVDADQEIE